MAQENKFGYDEVTDTLGDLIEAAGPNGIRSAFKKGQKFELVKFLIEAAEVYPTVNEMINDFATFWAQTKDLLPQESLSVIGSIKVRFPQPDPVQAKIIAVLENSALTQEYLQDQVIGGAKVLIDRWGSV